MDRQPGIWDHCLEYASATDVGMRRANNQDSMAVAPAASQERFDARGHVFVVADGMGAHAAGELASKLATDFIPLTYNKLLDLSPPDALLEATRQANRHIHARGEADPSFRGMGTTVDTLIILPQGALVGHVGDSRVYRLRDECLEQLTFDHSLVWEMRAAGHLPEKEEDIPSFIPRNVITRSMGPNPEVQVDLEGPFPIQPGDTFLLCSDGLTGRVNDTEIGQILTCLTPLEAAQALIDLANLRGGPDNITVVIARVTAPQRLEATSGSYQAFENGRHKPRSVHAAAWTVLGILVLAAAVFGMLQQLIAAGICLLAAGLGGAGALVYRYTNPGTNYFDSRLRGKGPYRQTLCSPDMKYVGVAKDLANQLHEAAEKEGWEVEWGPYQQHRNAAVAAATAGNLAEAGGEFFRAVTYMMGQVKRQKDRGKDADRAAGLF
ncbi:MAG: PP2C family protein-serine/threonine phosphatase [Thermoguttaceae bacterium]